MKYFCFSSLNLLPLKNKKYVRRDEVSQKKTYTLTFWAQLKNNKRSFKISLF